MPLRMGMAAVLAAALFSGAVFLYRGWSKPAIGSLDPVLAEPGAVVSVKGRNFGPERGDSRIEIDGVNPTASSYLSWSDDSISLRLPSSIDSGLVYVVTRYGRSNPKLFMNKARLPQAAQSGSAGGPGPFISSLSQSKGEIGSLLLISGRSFGANRGEGEVLFSWSPESPPSSQREDTLFVANSASDLGYEVWSDKEIRVRVPDGASSGAVYVKTQAGTSNGLFFSVETPQGIKRYHDRRSYSISYSVGLSRVQASGANEFYLYIPRPVQSASQRLARTLALDPLPLVTDFKGVGLYRFKNLATEASLAVTQSFLVQSYAVEARLRPEAVRKPAEITPLMAAYVKPDPLVPSTAPEILALAKRLEDSGRNPVRSARAVFDFLTREGRWNEFRGQVEPLAVLEGRTHDAISVAVLGTALLRAMGIPAIPVTGLLVDSSRKTVQHAWIEFYVYGFGWVPMDPVLGSGARPKGFEPAFPDSASYFAALDNRRIAFSRGYTSLTPMAPAGRRSSPSRPLGFQSFYEEVVGAMEAYSSFWGEVEVTGTY